MSRVQGFTAPSYGIPFMPNRPLFANTRSSRKKGESGQILLCPSLPPVLRVTLPASPEDHRNRHTLSLFLNFHLEWPYFLSRTPLWLICQAQDPFWVVLHPHLGTQIRQLLVSDPSSSDMAECKLKLRAQ